MVNNKRDWKPGDVVTLSGGSLEYEGHAALVFCTEQGWVDAEGDGRALTAEAMTRAARPLVVIDPEKREEVERLADLIAKSGAHRGRLAKSAETGALADALREFANPTPPKPPEPTGLGAVVEDAEGLRWLRVFVDVDDLPTWAEVGNVSNFPAWRRYADLNVVRVLSEGVSDE